MRSNGTLIGLVYLVGGLLLLFVADKALTSSFATFNVPNKALLGENFTLSTLIALVVSGAVAGFLFTGEKYKAFVGDAIDETSKVAWPEWSETKMNTVVVIVFSFVSAGILGVFDAVFSWLTNNNLFLY